MSEAKAFDQRLVPYKSRLVSGLCFSMREERMGRHIEQRRGKSLMKLRANDNDQLGGDT